MFKNSKENFEEEEEEEEEVEEWEVEVVRKEGNFYNIWSYVINE